MNDRVGFGSLFRRRAFNHVRGGKTDWLRTPLG